MAESHKIEGIISLLEAVEHLRRNGRMLPTVGNDLYVEAACDLIVKYATRISQRETEIFIKRLSSLEESYKSGNGRAVVNAPKIISDTIKDLQRFFLSEEVVA